MAFRGSAERGELARWVNAADERVGPGPGTLSMRGKILLMAGRASNELAASRPEEGRRRDPRGNCTGSEKPLIRFGLIEMEHTSAVQRLSDYLVSQEIPSNHGVSENRITAFEHQHKIRMPADLRHYFMTINGTAGAYAYGIIRFWSLDEFKSVAEEVGSAKARSNLVKAAYHELFKGVESCFVFADYLHESQFYAIHLSLCESSEANQIIILDGSAPLEVADNFSDFIDTYITSPERLRLAAD